MLQCSDDFGMMQVRPPFSDFCNPPGIQFGSYKKKLRILAGGTLVAKNQKRIFCMDDGRDGRWIRAHPGILLRYVGRFLEKPLRGNYLVCE